MKNILMSSVFFVCISLLSVVLFLVTFVTTLPLIPIFILAGFPFLPVFLLASIGRRFPKSNKEREEKSENIFSFYQERRDRFSWDEGFRRKLSA